MPVNNYSVGRDLVLDVVTPTGPFRISKITGFSSRPIYDERKVRGMDGVTDHLTLPDCWEGDFEVERQNAEVDKFFATLESDYFAGQNIANMTITETITEASGAISQFRYENVQLTLKNAGEWKGDDTVKQSIGFFASRRKDAA